MWNETTIEHLEVSISMKTTTLMDNEITLHLFDAIPSIKLYRCDVIFSQLGSFNNEIKLFECPIALQ